MARRWMWLDGGGRGMGGRGVWMSWEGAWLDGRWV